MAKSHIISQFSHMCRDIDIATSVPDGYLVPLITSLNESDHITHIPAAREEECLGIASGAAMSGKRALVMMQNVGFLNAIGCFSTLCLNYKTPFVLLISHRGNLYDKTKYDVPKYRYFNQILSDLNVFHTSWRDFKDEPDLINLMMDRAYTAMEPTILLLDQPPAKLFAKDAA